MLKKMLGAFTDLEMFLLEFFHGNNSQSLTLKLAK